MVLTLSAEQINAIKSHAERIYPEECCGLLVGRFGGLSDQTGARFLSEIVVVENDWTPAIEALPASLGAQLGTEAKSAGEPPLGKSRRYWIDPRDLLGAQRYARDRQLDIIGIYHSHPDHPAIPSECDRTLAWPEYSYLIVSVQKGKATDLKGWRLDGHHQFQPESLLLCQPSSTSPDSSLSHP